MNGTCRLCGYDAGVLNLRNGLCASCLKTNNQENSNVNLKSIGSTTAVVLARIVIALAILAELIVIYLVIYESPYGLSILQLGILILPLVLIGISLFVINRFSEKTNNTSNT